VAGLGHPPKCWTRPIAQGLNIPRETAVWNASTDDGRLARRECVQRHVFAAHGLDTLREYFMQGCNVPPMLDFDSWAQETGCGSEPLNGPLLIHTAWSGPYDHVREDMDALVDSFLATQVTVNPFVFINNVCPNLRLVRDQCVAPSGSMRNMLVFPRERAAEFVLLSMRSSTKSCRRGGPPPHPPPVQDLERARFVFWFLEEPVNMSAAFVRKYSGAGDGAVEFREARLVDFAKETSMEGRAEFLQVNWSAVEKGPRWKANMFRVLVLHKQGGVWVDTDTVLLRDLRPLVEFCGELASKLTMSLCVIPALKLPSQCDVL
jgi:hypothetical protein